MSPHETLFRLDSTAVLSTQHIHNNDLCPFTVHDFPGDWDLTESMSSSTPALDSTSAAAVLAAQRAQDVLIFGGSPLVALIFVLDAQDEPYDHTLARFAALVARAVAVNPDINIELFINKVDGELFLSDEAKYDCRRDVMSQVQDELGDVSASKGDEEGGDLSDLPIGYYLTSIYDHSIFEAFSKVVQKLIPTLPTIENLLNVLVSSCRMEKAFLYDVVSKLYISTDSSPVDAASVELCSDMIDVVLDVSGIYGVKFSKRAVSQAAIDDAASENNGEFGSRSGEARSMNSEGETSGEGAGDSSYYDSQSSSR